MTSAKALPVQDRLLPLFLGYFIPKALAAAAHLDIADRLTAGPASAEDLAKQAGADAPSLYRLLRTLASVGVFQEDEQRRFSNTDLSDALRSDLPTSMKSWAFSFAEGPLYEAFNETTYSVRTGKCGFTKAFGSHPFEYMAQQSPEFGRWFGEAMTSLTANENDEIHPNVDFSRVKTLVDVGGGNGKLIASFLQKYPALQGTLYDRPEVIERGRELVESAGVADRCRLVGGNFFSEVPSGADAYSLKYIMHDWSDEESLKILRNIHRASGPGTRLLIVDMVVEPGNEPSFAKLVDFFGLVFYGGGRERTRVEFDALLRQGGFRLLDVKKTKSFIYTIEAVRD